MLGHERSHFSALLSSLDQLVQVVREGLEEDLIQGGMFKFKGLGRLGPVDRASTQPIQPSDPPKPMPQT